MYVGGEFYDDPRWLLDQPQLDTRGGYFLNGGRACLTVIADALLARGISSLLLPDYLCPDILDVLASRGLRWTFYTIKPDLSPNLEDLRTKAHGTRAIYFINYFGFPQAAATLSMLTKMQSRGSLLIEDNVHLGFAERTIGDFVFNSLRKLAPVDGGYLWSRIDLASQIANYPRVTGKRLPVMRAYRRDLADYAELGLGDHGKLVALYEEADALYRHETVIAGDDGEQTLIARLDWQRMRAVRRNNYLYLLELVQDLPGLEIIYPALPDNALPLGLPVYVSAGQRDRLLESLAERGIGLMTHWHEILSDPRLNQHPTTVDMAGRMITLVCDHRTTHRQLDYLAVTLRELLLRNSQTA